MIDFSKITGWSTARGALTQVADSAGRVIWAVQSESNEPVVLEVAKITSDTYAGGAQYPSEEFILLDIYPEKNGTVKVTYGGLTKTITDTSGAEEPNAQQVFFGTFNGVSDSVTTPASGTITIKGKYRAYGCGSFFSTPMKGVSDYCACINNIVQFGKPTLIPIKAFYNCTNLTSITIPDSVISIDGGAFNKCSNLTSIVVDADNAYYSSVGGVLFNKNKTELCAYPTASGHYTIPDGVVSVADYAFADTNIEILSVASSVKSIGIYACYGCSSMITVLFANTSGWYVTQTKGAISGTSVTTIEAYNNAKNIRDKYYNYYWYRP